MTYTQEQKDQWKANRMLRTEQVIQKLSSEVKPFASVVGVWVWLTFQEKPDQAILDQVKELGFKWNRSRKVWQHPAGVFSTKSPTDPRFKYGSTPVIDLEETTHQEPARV